jgi:O-antigen/teichoic acid export membrane protein
MFNLAGSIFPALVSLVTVPLYLTKIGVDRYGVLALVWMFLGYFGVFDMGLSRAAANQIAKTDSAEDVRAVFWTALCMNGLIGLLWGLVLYFIGDLAFRYLFKMPGNMRDSVISVMPWLAFAVPLAIISGVLTGTMEGRERFLTLNLLGVMSTILLQVVPLAVAYFYSPRLLWLIPAAITVRAISLLPLTYYALKVVGSWRPRLPDLRLARILFSYGAWISVSNLIVPFFGTLDKLMIGSLVGVAGVSYYTIPERLARQTSIFPGALTRTLFPQISAGDEATARVKAQRSLNVLYGIITPMIVIVMIGMHPFLDLWIGDKFAAIAAPIGIVIAMTIWLNGLAYVPSTFLQARGRPDLTARFHMIEIIPHVIFLWFALHWFGLMGGAIALVVVTLLDTGLLFWGAQIKLWTSIYFIQGAVLLSMGCTVGLFCQIGKSFWYALGVTVILSTLIWGLYISHDLRNMAYKGYEIGKSILLRF